MAAPAWACAAAVALAVTVVHWPGLSAGALAIDDSQYLTNNALVRRPSLESAWRFLVEVRRPSTVTGYYQPLTMISLMLDAAAGGTPDNLRPFHRTSLALHAANAAMIVLILVRLLGSIAPAALAGLLWGLHPLTVESVVWVAERKTVLSTFFALLSMLLHLRFVAQSRAGWRVASVGAFALGLLAKPTVTPLPVILLLLDYWPLQRLSWRSLREKAPFLAVAALAAVVTIVSQRAAAGATLPGERSFVRVLLSMLYGLAFYPFKVVWPVDLASCYSFPRPFNFATPTVAAGIVLALLGPPLLVWLADRTRAWLTGALIFAVAIVPALGVISFTRFLAADRYAYWPMLGAVLVLSWLISRAMSDDHTGSKDTEGAAGAPRFPATGPRSEGTERQGAGEHGPPARAIESPRGASAVASRVAAPGASTTGGASGRRGRHAFAVVAVLALAGIEARLSRGHIAAWRDTEAYYRMMIAHDPAAAFPRNELGFRLMRAGRLDEARTLLADALERDPDFFEARNNMASLLLRRGRPAEALPHARRAVELDVNAARARVNLGRVLGELGDLSAAEACFREALRLEPDNARACNNLGQCRLRGGDAAGAVAWFERALALDPTLRDAQDGLARARQLLRN